MANDGSVKIDVELVVDKADTQARALATTLKSVDIDGKVITDTNKLTDALRQSSSQAKQTESTFKSTNATLKSTVTAYRQLESIQRANGLETSANVSKLNAYRAELARVQGEMNKTHAELEKLSGDYSTDGQKINELKSKYAQLTSEQQIYTKGIGDLQKKVGALTPEMALAIDKTKQLGQKWQDAGEKMSSIGTKATMGFTVPVVTALGAATKASVDFNSQMAKIKPLLNDGTVSASELDKQMKNLGDHSKQWSVQYGIATSSVNEGMETLIKRGYTYNQTIGAMPSILQAAKASGDDFNTVMQVSTSTLEQFGLKSNNTATMLKNTQRVTDDLSYVANKTSSGFSDLGLAMAYVGPTAKSMGQSLELTTAELGEMSQQGIEGEKAGTGLRSVLSSLTNPIGQNVEGMKKLGVNTAAFKKGTIGLPDVIDTIRKNTQGWSDAEKSAAMQQAFGIDGQTAMNVLVNEGSKGIRDLTSAQKEATGYTKSQAQQQMESSKAHMQQLKAATNELAIEVGDKLLPQITDLVKNATNLVEWFSNLDDGTQKLIINTMLATAAGGPLLVLFGKLTGGVGALIKTSAGIDAWLFKIRNGAKDVEAVGTATATAAPKFQMLKSATAAVLKPLASIGPMAVAADAGLGSLAIAAAPVALAVAGIGTAAYFAIKAEREHQQQLAKQKKTYDEYGTQISTTSQKAIKSFNDLHQSAQNDMALLDTSVGSQSKKLSSDIADKYGKMADMIVDKIDQASEKGQQALNSLGASYGTAGGQWAKAINDGMDAEDKKTTDKVNKAKQTIDDLLKSVNGDFTKLTNSQRQQLQTAEATIDEQTSVFGMAYKDQVALQKSYADQHGKISDAMYKKDVKDMNSLYKESESAATKHYKTQKKAIQQAYDDHEISKEQYTTSLAVLDDKKNADQAKAGITYSNTAKALVKSYKNTGEEDLKNHKTLQSAYSEITATGQRLYESSVTGEMVTRKEWIKEAKESNEKYLQDQVTSHGSIEKNLKKFQKAQKDAYEQMGMDEQTATAQAKVDADELYEATTQQGEKIKAAGKSAHDAYIKGLKDGTEDPASVAKKWGLDLSNTTDKIDLGSHGQKTAKEFWDDFNSGSTEGYEEAKVYMNTIMDGYKETSTKKMSEVSSADTKTFREGLNAGVLSLKDLKGQFGNTVLDLFPKDLKGVSDSEMKTLRQGLSDGTISLKALKNRFGDNIYDLFPKDLSSISKSEIASLKKGLSNGTISSADLKKKYSDQYDSIFKKDLSSLGKDDVKTLNTGLKLGVIDDKTLKKQYGDKLNDIYNKDLSSLGKDDIKTLANGIKAGIPGVQEQMESLATMVGNKAKVDITGEGTFTMSTLLKAYENGQLNTSQFMEGFQKLIHQSLTINGQPHGKSTMDSFNYGLEVFANGPLSTSAKTGTGVSNNLNQGIDAINNLSTAAGGKSSAKKSTAHVSKSLNLVTGFKTGTRGVLSSATPAIVGDGGEPELIDYGNGQIELSPNVSTFRYLPAGAQVFSGPDTRKTAPILHAMGMPMFAGGSGGSIMDWVKNLFGDVFGFLEHPIDNWKKLVDNSYDMTPFSGASATNIGSPVKEFEKKQTAWLKKLELAANPPGSGVERWRPYVLRALAMNGASTSDAMVAKILRQINTESGGNPNAMGGTDGLNDGRAMGLMQVKPGTFKANAFPGHMNQMNGFDSLLAGIHYAMKRYGPGMSFLGHGHGYDKGGISTEPELAAVSEHGQTELHIPDDQSALSKKLTEMAVKMSFGGKAFIATTAEEASGFRSLPADSSSSAARSVVTSASSSGPTNTIKDYTQKLEKIIDRLDVIAGKNLTIDRHSFSKSYESYGSAQRVRRAKQVQRGLAIDVNI